MATLNVSIINSSTVVTDDQLEPVVAALQVQVERDFGPAWGVDASLTFVPSGGSPDPATWWLTVLDNSDHAGVLGYHDRTSAGLPHGKVFAGTDLLRGHSWTVTASHELLEMLADPDVSLVTFVQTDAHTSRLYAYEVADPCEADQYGYDIDGTTVSDFVMPAWFESFWAAGATQFDQQGLITAPLTVLAGGYASVFDLSAGAGWSQVFGKPAGAAEVDYSYTMRAHLGSRRERRRTPRSQWLTSLPPAQIVENARRLRARAVIHGRGGLKP
jgi:hypothetical protein